MKTIGGVLKEARESKGMSHVDLEKETKIKTSFIKAIENDDWLKLPEYTVVVGFVKSLAGSVDISKEQAVALLRRDYLPKSKQSNVVAPKPDIKEKFTWNPKMTFLVGVVIVAILITSYLIIQYQNYIRPPELAIISPQEGQQIDKSPVVVFGNTDSEASVIINNQPVLVEEDGTFTAEIEVFEGTKELVVISKSRSGKETTVRRTIEPKLTE